MGGNIGAKFWGSINNLRISSSQTESGNQKNKAFNYLKPNDNKEDDMLSSPEQSKEVIYSQELPKRGESNKDYYWDQEKYFYYKLLL